MFYMRVCALLSVNNESIRKLVIVTPANDDDVTARQEEMTSIGVVSTGRQTMSP